MKIAVIGANGRTGREFVSAALLAGHQVAAGIHRESRLASHAHLTILPCDATQPREVAALIAGTDAVVMLIGHVRGSAPTVQTDATKVVIEQMKKAGITRLVSLTGTGVRRQDDRVTVIDRMLNSIVAKVDPDRINDGIHYAKEIEMSGLDWTVLRVLKLEAWSPTPVVPTLHGPTALWVSRHQVADALLGLIEDRAFISEMPILSPKSKA